jgi:hypothetical protein
MGRLVDDLRPADIDNVPRPVAPTLQVSLDWGEGQGRSNWQVRTTQTDTPFGGKRVWFSCPRCERRCRKLYADESLRALGCRVCLGLRYFSQRRAANKIRLVERMARVIRDMHAGP